jgi:hypothetical protein
MKNPSTPNLIKLEKTIKNNNNKIPRVNKPDGISRPISALIDKRQVSKGRQIEFPQIQNLLTDTNVLQRSESRDKKNHLADYVKF